MQTQSAIDKMIENKDYTQALEAINTIDHENLKENEIAYYSLLKTQVDYKAFSPITNDSTINQAVKYYENSDDKEKATRSVLYQGCVNEVLGNPEKAVDCYNRAEENAETGDLANRSYAKLRLGFLYQSQFIGSKKIALNKFQEALDLYRQLNDTHYMILCLSEIGGLYRELEGKSDSALYYINQAIQLSASDPKENYYVFSNYTSRALYFAYKKNDYISSKNDALRAINSGGEAIDHPRAHLCAALSYIKLNDKDSSLYYLQHAPKLSTPADTVMYYQVLKEVAFHDNDWKEYAFLHGKEIAYADSILVNSLNHRLLTIEKKYDLQQEELKNVTLRSKLRGAWLTVALALLVAFSLFHFAWQYRNKLKTKENEYELMRSELNVSLLSLKDMQTTISNYQDELKEAEAEYRAELAQKETQVSELTDEIDDMKISLHKKENEHVELNEKLAALEAKEIQSDEIKAIIDGQIKVVHELIQSSYELDVNRFINKFKTLMTMPESKRTATYWSNLKVLTNDLYDNILEDAIDMARGKLNDKDVNLIALLCCGYTRTVIMICMKYNHIVTISNMKSKIAKKMGIPSLDEFIRPYQEKYKKSLK